MRNSVITLLIFGGLAAAALGCGESECESGQTRCQGMTQIEACEGGSWGAPQDCQDTYMCHGDDGSAMCMAPCENGTKQCDGDDGYKTCGASGMWGATTACEDGHKCDSDTATCVEDASGGDGAGHDH